MRLRHRDPPGATSVGYEFEFIAPSRRQVSPPEVEVWIDAQDQVHQMRLVVTDSLGEQEESTTTAVTIDYISFGPGAED